MRVMCISPLDVQDSPCTFLTSSFDVQLTLLSRYSDTFRSYLCSPLKVYAFSSHSLRNPSWRGLSVFSTSPQSLIQEIFYLPRSCIFSLIHLPSDIGILNALAVFPGALLLGWIRLRTGGFFGPSSCTVSETGPISIQPPPSSARLRNVPMSNGTSTEPFTTLLVRPLLRRLWRAYRRAADALRRPAAARARRALRDAGDHRSHPSFPAFGEPDHHPRPAARRRALPGGNPIRRRAAQPMDGHEDRARSR